MCMLLLTRRYKPASESGENKAIVLLAVKTLWTQTSERRFEVSSYTSECEYKRKDTCINVFSTCYQQYRYMSELHVYC